MTRKLIRDWFIIVWDECEQNSVIHDNTHLVQVELRLCLLFDLGVVNRKVTESSIPILPLKHVLAVR